jgi:hypothetical protein
MCGLTLLAALNACGGWELPGKAAPEWDGMFQRESGWIGTDGNYSIPLSGDTTTRLFSDTFVGKVKDGKRLDACMVNNSIALQARNQPAGIFLRLYWPRLVRVKLSLK